MRQSLKQALLGTVAGGVLAVAGGVGSVQALTFQQLIDTYPIFDIEDQDFESQNVDLNQNGLLDVGDTLRGIVEFNFFVDQTPPGFGNQIPLNGTTNSHLSAVFEIQVTNKVTANPVSDGGGNLLFDYTFGVASDFAYGPDNMANTADDYPNGAMIALYEDNTDNFTGDNCTVGPTGSCEGNVTDGTLVIVQGFGGVDLDEAWKAFDAPENTSLPQNFLTSTELGSFNYAVSTLYSTVGSFSDTVPVNPLIITGAGNGFAEWSGSGSIKGTRNAAGEQTTAYTATTNAVQSAIAVSEPATLGLLGFGLLGLGFAVSRRRRVA
jgi:hypothetical protein